MVFPSISAAYLDPTNWQQQTNLQQGGNSQVSVQHLHPPPPLPSPAPLHSHGVGARPGSMADRARHANIPMPDAALKCPRCESTNTKFCYFNNYSLSQPRHFCKTCRRYWTRGGALRNVPVGGGCRRNKRAKGSNMKSPVVGDRQIASTTSCSSFAADTNTMIPPLRFMAPLHNLAEFSSPQDNIGLNYGSALSTHVPQASDFQIGSAFVGGNGSLFAVPGMDQWKLPGQSLSFFGGFDNSSGSCSSGGMFPYEGGVDPQSYGGENNVLITSKLGHSGATQFALVKMEENQEVNLSKHFSGINHNGSDQSWNGTAWNNITCFSSSSATNPI